MHPSLHKIIHGPHSPAVVEMLQKGGWHEGYRPDWRRIKKWTRLFADEDRFAEEFMEAYFDIELSIELPGDTPQDWGERAAEMNPWGFLEYIDRDMLDRFNEAVGERLFPVGNEEITNILLLGNHGRFFKTTSGDYNVYCVGEGWDGLLDFLKTGDQSLIFKWPGR